MNSSVEKLVHSLIFICAFIGLSEFANAILKDDILMYFYTQYISEFTYNESVIYYVCMPLYFSIGYSISFAVTILLDILIKRKTSDRQFIVFTVICILYVVAKAALIYNVFGDEYRISYISSMLAHLYAVLLMLLASFFPLWARKGVGSRFDR